MKTRNEDGCVMKIQKDRPSHISGVINPKKDSLTIFIKLTNAHIKKKKKKQMHISFNPEILLLGIYPSDICFYMQNDI